MSTILSLKLLKFTDLISSIVFVCQNAMTSLIMTTWYIVRLGKAVEESQEAVNCTVYKLRLMFTVLTSTLSTQVHTSTYCSKVLEYKYKYIGEIKKVFKKSTSTFKSVLKCT